MMGYEPVCFVVVDVVVAVVAVLVVVSLEDVLLSLRSRRCSLMMLVLMLMWMG